MAEPSTGVGDTQPGGEGASWESSRCIGPFRLLERIGTGGMGVVYLGERRAPIEQRAALKVIRTDRLDKTYRARFAMEQSALARMDHPNIARLLDAGDSDGQSWFAMEYVPGTPLSDYCREHRLSIEARLGLFAQICDGVQHAHMKGILHRDLKPGNILVREIDGRPIAKIIDFGLAQPIDPLQIRATLHESMRQIVGTFAYMSPEQAERTEGDLDTRTDVYSLGVVLYELLTGEVPLDLEAAERRGIAWIAEFLREHEPKKPSTRLSTLGERLSSTAAERATSPQRLRSRVRGDLDWVTMKALARDRQQRYATVRELGREVERVLRHEPVEAGPPSGWYVAKKWVRRHARGVAVAGAVLAAGSGFAGIGLLHAAEARRLERDIGLASEPLVALGLLETVNELGTTASTDAVDRWLASARRLLANAPLQQQRASPGADASRLRYLDTTLPLLESATERAADLRSEMAWIHDRMGEAAPAWRECIAAICSDARYGIDALEPQFGLVPLGRDPASGLFEFEVLDQRTEDPEQLTRVRRGDDGQLQLGPLSAVVLVLVPGGTFAMGTPEVDNPWIDQHIAKAERPVRDKTVAPFLIGKFEMTAAQYVGDEPDPSYWTLKRFAVAQRELGAAQDVTRTRRVTERGLPVNDLSWLMANRRLVRAGLRLPTEIEWEYAARAWSTGPWSCDANEESLRQHANLADAVGGKVVPVAADSGVVMQQGDGVAAVAPVGSFRANAFGLHDMHGNVAEWCADPLRDDEEGRPAESDATPDRRVLRGGSFESAIQHTRSAARRQANVHTRLPDCGCRAARDLTGMRMR